MLLLAARAPCNIPLPSPGLKQQLLQRLLRRPDPAAASGARAKTLLSFAKPQALCGLGARRTYSTAMSASDDATAAAGVHLTDNYSLWVLPPPGPLRQRLQAEIDALAEKYGGPKFPAHVTVLPDIKQPRDQLLATAASLAAQLPPYDITLLSVSCGAIYHQCVYLLCAKDVDTVAAAAAARRAYGMPPPPDKPYMPHLSLLYSDIDPDTRRAVAADVTRRLFGEGSGYDTLLTGEGWSRRLTAAAGMHRCTLFRLVSVWLSSWMHCH